MAEALRERQGTRSCAPGSWIAVLGAGRQGLEVSADDAAEVEVADGPAGRIVVGGRAHATEDGADLSAHALLAAFGHEGDDVLAGLGGVFGLVVWDERQDSLLCVRDPLGVHPLFWTRTTVGVMLSPSIETLLRQPEVSREINLAAVADHLRHHWPRPDETYFAGIQRLLPGSWLRIQGTSTRSAQYWDPIFPCRDPDWIDEADLGRFEELLHQSVGRLAAGGRTGIFLSGGLDSVSVGALATDLARRAGHPGPLALSLAFPEPWNEERMQASVAAQLGMPQVIAPLEDALGDEGLVRAAVYRGAFGAPIQNPWLPAYRWLAHRARAQGRDVILTGSGGDEWLMVSPLYAADLIRSGRLGTLLALWRNQARSYNVSPGELARNLLWRFGVRPLLVRRHAALLQAVAPCRYVDNRLRHLHNGLERRTWLAPDPALRRQLEERDEEFARKPGDDALLPLSGPLEYFRDCRKALTHPLVSLEAEEIFEYSRGAGVRVAHPFWDTRLVEFLHATPPELLNRGGRSKGLVRQMLAQRFPELGFERQRKIVVGSFFTDSVLEQAPGVWRELGGARRLAEAGVVDLPAVTRLFEHSPWQLEGIPDERIADPVWDILTIEGWLRRHG